MRRRKFIAGLGAACLWPCATHAQQATKIKRVAMIIPTGKPADLRIGGDPYYSIIFEEMKRLGYVEGVNLMVDRRSAEGRFDRFPEIARDVVATQPNVIYILSTRLALALQSETRTVPVVCLGSRSGCHWDSIKPGAPWRQRYWNNY